MRDWTVDDFDFELPPALIAQHPAAQRSASRLLDARGDALLDRRFAQLPELLQPGDLLILNDTQVLRARLFGQKASGGQVEMLIERVLAAPAATVDACPDDGLRGNGADPHAGEVIAHLKVSKKPVPGTRLHFAGGLHGGGFDATLLGRWPDAHGALFRLQLHGPSGESPWELMQRHGHLPLPPYIERAQNADHDPHAAQDGERYQTIFARHPGAVAAPTAALHFDGAVMAALQARGVRTAHITLHVGAGTFQPVRVQRIAEHHMHAEHYRIPAQTLAAIDDARAHGGRIVAVGTTAVRTLESWARSGQTEGETAIFITPGFDFRVVDMLLTNFHLPRSTLLMLVSAFAGYAHVRAAYAHAIAQGYRFFSYGDAMLLQRSVQVGSAGHGPCAVPEGDEALDEGRQ